MSTNEKTNEGVRAVDRALEILEAFQPGDQEMTVAQLLGRVDLSRPTLYRLLGTLQQRGFLVAQGDPLRYRLGPAIARLAHVWRASLNLPELAQPMMRRAWELSRETVSLFVRDGVYRVCVAELESPQPLSFRRGVGYRERLALGASGRAILAFAPLDEATRQSVYAGLDVNAKAQDKELERVRKLGYATSRDELIAGAVAVAAPIFSGNGEVAGSLGIFGPSVRIAEARVRQLAEIVQKEASAIGRELGRVA